MFRSEGLDLILSPVSAKWISSKPSPPSIISLLRVSAVLYSMLNQFIKSNNSLQISRLAFLETFFSTSTPDKAGASSWYNQDVKWLRVASWIARATHVLSGVGECLPPDPIYLIDP